MNRSAPMKQAPGSSITIFDSFGFIQCAESSVQVQTAFGFLNRSIG
jgi:hypothetical protein